jgi:hypothetical protein
VPTRTNRIRRTLDALEAREVCWAGFPGLPLGGLSPIVHLGPTTPPAKPPAPGPHVADAVFTLHNGTTHAITVSVRWAGAATAEAYTLQPGESRPVWVREVERFSVQTALVRVDGGRQVFKVKAVLTAESPNGPVGPGTVCTIGPGPAGGVALHSTAGPGTGVRI